MKNQILALICMTGLSPALAFAHQGAGSEKKATITAPCLKATNLFLDKANLGTLSNPVQGTKMEKFSGNSMIKDSIYIPGKVSLDVTETGLGHECTIKLSTYETTSTQSTTKLTEIFIIDGKLALLNYSYQTVGSTHGGEGVTVKSDCKTFTGAGVDGFVEQAKKIANVNVSEEAISACKNLVQVL